MAFQEVTPDLARHLGVEGKGGALVSSVVPQSPADQAGVLEDDLIVNLGEQPTESVDDLHKLLTQLPIDVPATMSG